MPQGYKHLTAEQKKTILAVYQETKLTKKAVEASGASYQQTASYLRSQGIELSRLRNNRAIQNLDELKKMAADGLSLSEMSRRLGSKTRTISATLKKLGIQRVVFRQVGKNNCFWRGGRVIDKTGYVLLHMPDHPDADWHGYVREHRLVMEKVLGRRLLRTEVVHHKDDDRQNNDPSNLHVFASNGEHLRETLTGKKKNISPEGKQRILEAIQRRTERRRAANRQKSTEGGDQ